MPLRILKIAFSLVVLVPGAQGESVKADTMAAKGCTPRVSVAEARAALKRFHLQTLNARPREVQTLGTALVWIEKLNGGKPLSEAVVEGGYVYNFQNAHRFSHQASGEIRVNRNGIKNYGENTAQLVHELGHLIGNRGGYEAYHDFMGPHHYCRVSSYSDDNLHEQFAEVFAAFVTRPDLIKRNPSPDCRKAFQFFAKQVFANAGPVALRCMTRQTNILNAANAKAKPAVTPASTPAQ